MVRLYLLLALVDLALVVIALIDCLAAEEFEIRALPRIAWVFIILLFSPVGAIVWFVAGRPQRNAAAKQGSTWRTGRGFPEESRPRQPVAPDDDPEFLKGLAARGQEDADLLRRWEDDLRRREQQLKRDTRPEGDET